MNESKANKSLQGRGSVECVRNIFLKLLIAGTSYPDECHGENVTDTGQAEMFKI